jgi:hypothetical protein
MGTITTRPEFRTPEQIAADEEIAAEAERYVVKDATTGWAVFAATDARRALAAATAGDANNAVAPGGLDVPFLWNGRAYRITRAAHRGGTTTVEAEPADPAFVAEVRRRIDASPCRVLTFYQGFGFVCFPEDHAKYQG